MQNIDESVIKKVQKFKKEYPKESYQTLVNKLKKEGIEINADEFKHIWLNYGKVKFLNKKDKGNMEKIWSTVVKHQKALNDVDTTQEEVDIEIDDDRPIALSFFGDLHIGNIGTNYEKLLQDVELMRSTPGLYICGTGDEYDNYNSHSPGGGKFEAIIPPSVQKKLALDVLKKLKRKYLTTVLSCHTSWSRDSDDFNWAEYAADEIDAVNLGYGGLINLNLNNINYSIRVRHRMRGGSVNPMKMHTNWLEQRGFADIIAVGHYHNPYIGQIEYQSQTITTIRSGSYKEEDRFGRKVGDYKGIIGIPTVILFPNSKKIVPFYKLQDAVDYLQKIRK